MKKAVIIGAGNIGRGFIGQIFSEGGWEVCFLDVSENVVNTLNLRGEYPLDIVTSSGNERRIIRNVRAVNGNDRENAAHEIASSDICVTCVGAKAIRFIIPNLCAGIRLRLAESGKPLDLLICENLMDADEYIRSLLEPELTPAELASVGLVETSVGRMVPVPDPELLKEDPLLVRAEAYSVLPCDRDAFRGEIPDVPNLAPSAPFRYIIERKLYIHNMGHALCAYLGMLRGYTYISEAIGDPAIRAIVREAMTESALALSAKFGRPLSDLMAHTSDLIRRFGNTGLGDTCARVGADIPRKLAASDRLTGAAGNVIETGSHPAWTAVGAGAALALYLKENPGDPAETFRRLTDTDGEYADLALKYCEMLRENRSLTDIIAEADLYLTANTPAIL